MPTVPSDTPTPPQDQYIERLEKAGERSYALIAAAPFVEGMRDSGYKSTATAIDELIDNAIEAEASAVHVAFQRSGRYVSAIAVIDDGHGMRPEMIRAAVTWGGTHRWNSRRGFGRYGFGLPSAAFSISRQYEVYSKTTGGTWHGVTVDLRDIQRGALTNAHGLVIAPAAEPAALPGFVQTYLAQAGLRLDQGTVVVLPEPDRLSPGFVRPYAFRRNMKRHVGLTYRGLLPHRTVCLGEAGSREAVVPIDPLFLTPGALGHDVGNGTAAEPVEPLRIEVPSWKTGAVGEVVVRAAYLPPSFQRDPTGDLIDARFKVMKACNAFLLVTRAGRQVDMLRRTRFPRSSDNKTLVNFDRNWAIELDFPPVLDEEFGVTVNKQQVTLSESMWSILAESGLPQMIKDLRERFKHDRKAAHAARTSRPQKRTTAASASRNGPTTSSERLEHEAAIDGPGSDDPARSCTLEATRAEVGYEVRLTADEEGPFFHVERAGERPCLHLNTAHRFWQGGGEHLHEELSDAPGSPQVRSRRCLELLLLALGTCEMDAAGERHAFYAKERRAWSQQLDEWLSPATTTDVNGVS